MNEEKKIAQALMDAMDTYEASAFCAIHEAVHPEESDGYDMSLCCWEYGKDRTECLIEACKKHGLSSNLWALLDLGMRWVNDIQAWCDDVLADKDVMDSVITQDDIDDMQAIADQEAESGK